jgi:hypothetical protein
MHISDDLTVLVKKDELIETLKKNRDEHVVAYQEALKGWRKKVVAACMETSQKAEKGELKKFPHKLDKLTDVPRSHEKDYIRVIQMLEMHTDGGIKLNAQDFARYVQDEWDWKHRWETSNSNYL